ncbi:MAG: hypothetical protein JXR65_10770 [Bacteroidales bacterium]|nr:hypothetical protein [Bacteroidales bacterium]
MKKIVLATSILMISLSSQSQKLTPGSQIDLLKLGKSGLLYDNINSVTPVNGLVRSYKLAFPEFEKGVINKSNICGWVDGYATMPKPFKNFKEIDIQKYDSISNSNCNFTNAFQLGYYLLMKLKDGGYLAMLPLVSDSVMSHIVVYQGNPLLRISTFGTDTYTGKAPLFCWAFGADPYTATHQCWELAVNSEFCQNNIQFRSNKQYPEVFEYLGWCTWEAFEGSITESVVSDCIKNMKQSKVPVRWVIVDDGYLDEKVPFEGAKRQLLSFGVNKKFPNGWKPITSLKQETGVKWMGIWRNMSGGMGGVSPEHTMTDLKDNLMAKTVNRFNNSTKEGFTEYSMIVKPDMASSEKFYSEMVNNTLQGGFDFMKVDFQTYNFWMYSGTGNAVNSAHQNNQALEAICQSNKMPLLNCISQCNVNVFNTKNSVISRASVDIKLDNDNMARTIQAYANNMWWGDILFGDLDMYHTSNEKTAQYLTIARAVSGGPVYISDKPEHFNDQIVKPLIFNDGKIIRALAPAVPLSESLFQGAEDGCYRVIAPTRHGSCAIAAFNFTAKESVQGILSANDYKFAAAKEQPFKGLWSLPQEGLVVYDQQMKTGCRLDVDYNFSIDRMKGKIFNVAPVNNGWAVIGRSDKYLGGCTFQIKKCTKSYLELILDESGPVVVFCDHFTPKINTGKLSALGAGFYEIDIPVGGLNKKIKLWR